MAGISNYAVGYDNIDIPAATSAGNAVAIAHGERPPHCVNPAAWQEESAMPGPARGWCR